MTRCHHKTKGPKAPRQCARPACVEYVVDGDSYPLCSRHRSREIRDYAERYGVETRELVGL